MKHRISLLVCMMMLLSACTSSNNYTDIPDVTVDVIDASAPYENGLHYTHLWQVSEEDQMDHPLLQREVRKIPISYPMTTSEQMEQYANALYEISVSLELLDPKLIPEEVLVFNDSIIIIVFTPEEYHDAYIYDGLSAHALISTEDGHVIVFDVSGEFITEQLS